MIEVRVDVASRIKATVMISKQIERRNLPGAEESPETREGTSRSLFFAANLRRPVTKASLVMNNQP